MFNTENPVVRDELWDRHKTIDHDVRDDEDAVVEFMYRWSERCANWNCAGCILNGDCVKQKFTKREPDVIDKPFMLTNGEEIVND